jgi:hypothetical protein
MRPATLAGCGAIALWATLGLLSRAAAEIPPLQLTAMSFTVSALLGLALLTLRGELGVLRQPPLVWLHGIFGLFGFHALYFAALWVAGVTSYEAPAFQLSVTRFYTNPPTISTDYATINKVFAWSAIRTDGKTIPSYVDEPRYVTDAGVATPFEWRLISVAPVVTRGQENVVTWIFIGRDKWAKKLYTGGTWEPEAL